MVVQLTEAPQCSLAGSTADYLLRDVISVAVGRPVTRRHFKNHGVLRLYYAETTRCESIFFRLQVPGRTVRSIGVYGGFLSRQGSCTCCYLQVRPDWKRPRSQSLEPCRLHAYLLYHPLSLCLVHILSPAIVQVLFSPSLAGSLVRLTHARTSLMDG